MTQLVPPPTAAVHASFVAAMAEFRADGRGGSDDGSMVAVEIREHGASWDSTEGFDRYTRWLAGMAREDGPRPDGWVPVTTLWWVDGREYLGRIAVRHRLTQGLLELGGHIGYDVRPSARRRGHATAMPRAVLPVARELGISSALVTCDEDNIGSRTVIERCGGVFEDQRGVKPRYWVPTR